MTDTIGGPAKDRDERPIVRDVLASADGCGEQIVELFAPREETSEAGREWCCLVTLSGRFEHEAPIRHRSALQALSMAIQFVRELFAARARDGEVLLWPGSTDELVDWTIYP